MGIFAEMEENNLILMNQIQDDEVGFEELKKQIEIKTKTNKSKISKVEDNAKRMYIAISSISSKASTLNQETNLKEKLESSPYLHPSIKSKINALFTMINGCEPDQSKTLIEQLQFIEQHILKLFNFSDDLADKHGQLYDNKFKFVEKERKKKRSDNAQSKILEDRASKIHRNLDKMTKRNNLEIFKGRKPQQRAKKNKLIRKVTKEKQSQADIDYLRYIGKITDAEETKAN